MARSCSFALATLVGVLWGCDGEFVNLGASAGSLGGGGTAAGSLVGVWEVQRAPVLPQKEDLLLASPSLDLRGELFFSAQERYSTEGGDPKPTAVFSTQPLGDGFREPMALPLGELVEVDVASPAVSWAGDELWLGKNVGGNTDVFRCSLGPSGCTTPERVDELSSPEDDAPRPPARGDTLMALSSKRHGGRQYQIYLTERDGRAGAWSEPSQASLASVNSPEYQSADGFLADDGLTLYFSSTRGGDSDLYVVRRTTTRDPFGAPEALADLNTSAEERMPWLSPDGERLYFVSNRATAQLAQYALFVAHRF